MNAIANPYEVTPSEKYPYVAPEPPAVEEGKLLSLTDADVEYLISLGLDPNEYAVYDFSYTVRGFYNSTEGSHLNTTHSTLSPKFIATEILGLSKMNWNSFNLYSQLPCTIESSNEIARIGWLLSHCEGSLYDYRYFM